MTPPVNSLHDLVRLLEPVVLEAERLVYLLLRLGLGATCARSSATSARNADTSSASISSSS